MSKSVNKEALSAASSQLKAFTIEKVNELSRNLGENFRQEGTWVRGGATDACPNGSWTRLGWINSYVCGNSFVYTAEFSLFNHDAGDSINKMTVTFTKFMGNLAMYQSNSVDDIKFAYHISEGKYEIMVNTRTAERLTYCSRYNDYTTSAGTAKINYEKQYSGPIFYDEDSLVFATIDATTATGGGDSIHVGDSAPTDETIKVWFDTDDEDDVIEEMSTATATAGTSTTGNLISAKVLSDAIDAKLSGFTPAETYTFTELTEAEINSIWEDE